MILKVFTVYDAAAGLYEKPFYQVATGQAVRAFSDAANNPESNLYRHPADFTLFEIGSYDDAHGVFENLEAKINLGTALQCKTPKENK